jgi:hypothetical protein
MVEILHTHDRMHAEMVRLALEAEGIRVESLSDNYDPYLSRHVLAVSDADAQRAIAIRRRLERRDAAPRPRDPPVRKSVVAAIIVFWIAVYLVFRWLNR